jgi:D-aspartate ligase
MPQKNEEPAGGASSHHYPRRAHLTARSDARHAQSRLGAQRQASVAADARDPAAAVLGLGENGYGIVRSLARKGVRVTGFYSEPKEFGRFSRYGEVHRLPVSPTDEQICRGLMDWRLRWSQSPILLPTSDHHALFLARHSERLAGHFRFYAIDPNNLQRIVDKAQMASLCRDANVCMPRTYVTAQNEDLERLGDVLAFPCLVKPNRSFDTPFPTGLKNFLAVSFAELLTFYNAYPQLKGTTICQEVIEGGDENIFQCTVLIRSCGTPGAVFCSRKLHQYRPGYGVMSFGRSEHNPVLSAQSLQLLQVLRYRGWASLEFKYRARDGRYYFIEMNPRLPWYNALFTDAGVNIPYLTYRDLAGKECPDPGKVTQRDGVYWLSFKLDLGWFLLTRRDINRVSLLSWLRLLCTASSYAWFDWRDPLPCLRAAAALLTGGMPDWLRAVCKAKLTPSAHKP